MKSQSRKAIPLAEARRLIIDCNIREPDEIDLALVAARYHILVEEKPLEGVEGRLVRKGNKAIISIQSSIQQPGRKRFGIAHELGHFFLHPKTRQLALCTSFDMNRWLCRRKDEESEANIFAAELLMPKSIFADRAAQGAPGIQLIENLAQDFKTTLTATAIQFVKYTQEPCVLVASRNGEILWSSRSESFSTDFRLRQEKTVHPYTCARDLHKTGQGRQRAQDISAGTWLEHYSPDGKEYVTEDSLRLGSYETVLSLIWIHEAL